MISLVVTPCPVPTDISPAPLKFAVTLDGDLVTTSHQPLVDAARVLIGRGHDPDEPTTMRHADKPYDSFKPMPLRYWAGISYTEGKGGMRSQPWVPHPDSVSRRLGAAHSEKTGVKVCQPIRVP